MFKKILKKIKKYDKIIIFPHMRPDGDCMGSAFGLKSIIETSFPRKEVYVCGESSEFTKVIGDLDTLEESDYKDALGISVDTANSDRIADQNYKLCDFFIKIDHHIIVESFGDLNYVDTSSPATAQIITEFMVKNKLKISEDGANALLFGILTDTGRFQYSSVTSTTFEMTKVLYEKGVDAKRLYAHLNKKTFEEVKYKGFMLQNLQTTEHGVLYFKVLPEYLEQFKVTLDQATSYVNEMSGFEEYPIWVLLAEYEEQIVRARIRSVDGYPINFIANEFNGGGHKNASGANLGTWENADKLLARLDEYLVEVKSK